MVCDDGQGAVPIDFHERAAVRLRRRTRRGARHPRSLRERVETTTAQTMPVLANVLLAARAGRIHITVTDLEVAKFHVDEEGGAGGHLRGSGRLRPERHNLSVLGQVWDGAGLR